MNLKKVLEISPEGSKQKAVFHNRELALSFLKIFFFRHQLFLQMSIAIVVASLARTLFLWNLPLPFNLAAQFGLFCFVFVLVWFLFFRGSVWRLFFIQTPNCKCRLSIYDRASLPYPDMTLLDDCLSATQASFKVNSICHFKSSHHICDVRLDI